ncbi:hypothetical protein BDV27DRAFT_42372 [Aspergillus caelatus]|uniref:Uncharacterized protein n=1 Tax=Aspergillus caelatus TaxID=61420 RepID=A0A5N6ZRT2_9EURO|nr:uncharacterized protein BDV27DRAFT_42372 [Aspergillus caelatus]KAE8360284.1 hypothetical protein BDV27DRAFT_42372 [Aspergillus caelatus]
MTLNMSIYGRMCVPLAINSVSGSKALVLGLEGSSLGEVPGRNRRGAHTTLKRTLKQSGNTNVRERRIKWNMNYQDDIKGFFTEERSGRHGSIQELRLQATIPHQLSRSIFTVYLVSAFLDRRVSHAGSHPGRSYDNVYHLENKHRSNLYEALRRR